MVLVVDAIKGIQPQTAECLIVGECCVNNMVCVINKIDLIPPEKRADAISRLKKRLALTLEQTVFSGCEIIALSARPGGGTGFITGDGALVSAADNISDTSPLVQSLVKLIPKVPRITNKLDPTCITSALAVAPFKMLTDHCFTVKGQGTVFTGTVVQGKVAVGDEVELPDAGSTHKVKSIQMFKISQPSADAGAKISTMNACFSIIRILMLSKDFLTHWYCRGSMCSVPH